MGNRTNNMKYIVLTSRGNHIIISRKKHESWLSGRMTEASSGPLWWAFMTNPAGWFNDGQFKTYRQAERFINSLIKKGEKMNYE